MRFIIRLIRKSLIKRPTWQSPHRHGTMQPPNNGNTEKRKALSETAAKDALENFPKAKVLCIIDGDTVIVAKGWSQIKIRLDSIDCPEDGQYWGDTAKYGLIKLIGGRKIHLEEYGLDFHGRTLATIYVRHAYKNEWINVNERMIMLGHAWVMHRSYDHLPKVDKISWFVWRAGPDQRRLDCGTHRTAYHRGNGELGDEV
jgi:endonuclease YncB( thermonuclease family)